MICLAFLLCGLLSFVCSLNCVVPSDQYEDVVLNNTNGWTARKTALADDVVLSHAVFVGLKQRNLPLLFQTAMSVSDPDSTNYGNHLSVVDVKKLVGLSEDQISIVMTWIHQHCDGCVVSSSATNDWLRIDGMTVAAAQRLFHVSLQMYDHVISGASTIRTAFGSRACIDSEIASLVSYIHNIDNLPAIRRPATKKLREPGQQVNPTVIDKVYGVNYTASGKTNASQAVAEFEEAYFYPTDVPIFLNKFNKPVTKPIIKGPNHPNSGYLGEATLDIEYIMGVGAGLQSWVFSVSALGLDLIAWAQNVTAFSDAPKVHSISWGSGESGYQKSEMNKVNVEFQKLAVMGFSIFVASGDDGTGHTGLWCGTFDPNFPASIPFATAVGGTILNSDNSETSWSDSGGGFSTVFDRPPYQASSVDRYLKTTNNLPDSSYYNPKGRGFPDVAALSTNFQVCTQNSWGTLSGTSAATPTFAALIALINDMRLQQNKPVLGFLNPALYKLDTVGYDITQGNNDSGECPTGFPAVKYWDAISGLGTPKFDQLASYLVGL